MQKEDNVKSQYIKNACIRLNLCKKKDKENEEEKSKKLKTNCIKLKMSNQKVSKLGKIFYLYFSKWDVSTQQTWTGP